MKDCKKDAIKNWEVKMAETTLQQCLAALCNAGTNLWWAAFMIAATQTR